MLPNRISQFRAAPLVLLAFGAVACSDDTGSIAGPDDLENITLSVRVHLLESDQSPPLDATLSAGDVTTLFGGVNEAWAQALLGRPFG